MASSPLGAGSAGELDELLGVTRDEEGSVAVLQAKLLADRLGALRAYIVRERARARALTPHHIAKAWLSLALRPGVDAIAKCP